MKTVLFLLLVAFPLLGARDMQWWSGTVERIKLSNEGQSHYAEHNPSYKMMVSSGAFNVPRDGMTWGTLTAVPIGFNDDEELRSEKLTTNVYRVQNVEKLEWEGPTDVIVVCDSKECLNGTIAFRRKK